MLESDFIIITRFCYRFRESDPLDKIISAPYWNKRLKLFKTFCLPSVIAQKNKDFIWILIVDPLLPNKLLEELKKVIISYPNIVVYPWNYRDHLSDPSWIARIHPLNKPLLITTRLDSDDSLSNDFTSKILQHTLTTKINGFLLISYAKGYNWNDSSDPRYPNGVFKQCQLPMSAQGQTLITYRNIYPLTVHIGNHRKLLAYFKDPKSHKLLKNLYEKTGDINLDPQNMLKLAKKRCLIINQSSPMYIRTIHENNHQQNLVKIKASSQDLSVIKKHFTIGLAL